MMKENILLSIIVPIYNVQEYINECIQSLLIQDISNYEIICVDDGSTDNSIEFLQKFRDNKIKIITQENKGLSGARNTGLKCAKGQYVMFIDSDDFIEKNCLKELLDMMLQDKLDVLAYNFLNYYSYSEKDIEKRNIPSNLIMSGLEYYKIMFNDKSCPMSWLYIYDRNFVIKESLFFCEGILHEDVEFLIRLLTRVKRMKYFDKAIYYYRRRENSIMTSQKYNPKKIPSFYKILETYEKEMMAYKHDEELMKLLKRRKLMSVYSIINEYTTPYKNIKLNLTNYEKKILLSILHECGGKKAKLISLSSYSLNLYIYILKFKKRLKIYC